MATVEFYETLSAGTVNAALPSSYNGWTVAGPLGVIMDGVDRVLTGKTDATTYGGASAGGMTKPVLAPGERGRVEGKLKITNSDFATKTNDFCNLGFLTQATPASVNVIKRIVWLDESGAISMFNGTTSSIIVSAANVPLNQWITFGIATDGTGKYTAYAYNAAGSLLGEGPFSVPADASIPLYAFASFNGSQLTADSNGWGTQFYMKEIIARNDFKQYAEVTQRRHLRFRPTINGEDACVTIPQDWNPGASGPQTKAIALGHGFSATAAFDIYGGINYVAAGFPYASCNVHGDSWGNAQSTSDIDALRQWLIDKLGVDSKIIMTGYSMGGLAAYNYASHYPARVDRIVTEAAVSSMYPTYAGYTASVNTAHGAAKVEDIAKEFDPIFNADKLAGIPIMAWAGTADTSIVPGKQGRVLMQKLAKAGGMVMWLEEPGETHSVDWDYTRNLDFIKAAVSNVDPNGAGNLVDQTSTALTQIVALSPHAAYRITTPSAGTVSYCLDAEQGAMTAVAGTQTTITTKSRRQTILLKTTSNWTGATLVRVR